jgi:hypothetical protein
MLRVPVAISVLIVAAASNTIIRPGARSSKSIYNAGESDNIKNALGSDVTQVGLWPMPVSVQLAGGNATFKQIGGPNEGAQSSDCPYVMHGPGDSLSICLNACANLDACTDVNWNPSIGDCVFRRCTDPLNPTLTPADGYVVWAVIKPVRPLVGVAQASQFKFVATGFTNDVLVSGIKRYQAMVFAFGEGNKPSQPVILSQVNVFVSSNDAQLRLGIDESYNITVSNTTGATISAVTVFGALHGLETFSQLVQYDQSVRSYQIVPVAIVDYPRFPFRGLMIDASRHYITVR